MVPEPSQKKTVASVNVLKSLAVESLSVAIASACGQVMNHTGTAPVAKPITLQNNFDPFRRLPNLAFSLNGRPRSMSVDGYSTATAQRPPAVQRPVRRNSILLIPKLGTIKEEDMEFGDDIENLFK